MVILLYLGVEKINSTVLSSEQFYKESRILSRGIVQCSVEFLEFNSPNQVDQKVSIGYLMGMLEKNANKINDNPF